MLKTSLLLSGLFASLFLASCGTMNSLKQTAANTTRNISEFSISDLHPSRVDVVEVREDKLEEMPSGHERALAFDQERKRSFWSSILPNFKELVLPEIDGSEISDSLLPPKPL